MIATRSFPALISALSFVFASTRVDAQAGTSAPAPSVDSSAIYSGVYASTFNESIFSACNVPGIGSGWWLRFANEEDGAFLRYQFPRSGMATLTHFIRVRGRVSAPGHYGLGFQTREIVVDSVLEISETPQPCPSYEDIPQPWEGVKSSGAPIIGAAITDDRAVAAVLDLEGTISIWSTQRGALLKRFQSEDKGESSWGSRVPMQFTRDGKRLAVGGTDGVVRIWNPLAGRLVWAFAATDTLDGTVNGEKRVAASADLTFNQSGTLLANMLNGKTVLWSTVDGKRLGTHQGGFTGGKFLFLGDTSFIASSDSGLMRIYPRLGGAPIWKVKTPVSNFNVMERSPDGRWLVVKSWGDTAFLLSVSEGRIGQSIAIPHWFGRGAIAFSPDGSTIATSGGANGIYLWETSTGRPVRSFQKYRMGVEKAWFTRDGKSIVTYSLMDTTFNVVHVDSARGRNASLGREPTQALWGANSRPAPLTPNELVGSMSGFVRDSAGKAIVGASVSMFDANRPGSAPVQRTLTNAAGRFLFQGIRVRHVTVRAEKRGFATGIGRTHLPAVEASVDFELKAERVGSSERSR